MHQLAALPALTAKVHIVFVVFVLRGNGKPIMCPMLFGCLSAPHFFGQKQRKRFFFIIFISAFIYSNAILRCGNNVHLWSLTLCVCVYSQKFFFFLGELVPTLLACNISGSVVVVAV